MTAIVNFSLEESCLIVCIGIRVVGKRYTMIYDLMAFIPHVSEAEIRDMMRSLTEREKVDGCNCGCRGDWEPMNYANYLDYEDFRAR